MFLQKEIFIVAEDVETYRERKKKQSLIGFSSYIFKTNPVRIWKRKKSYRITVVIIFNDHFKMFSN